mmetsp:Transcript_10615/g.20357  ORF Transcript_10615/g.20357 Transcript_10615/m.20357 type:complete len:316 (-) Transcript_10615:355-1302(-)
MRFRRRAAMPDPPKYLPLGNITFMHNPDSEVVIEQLYKTWFGIELSDGPGALEVLSDPEEIARWNQQLKRVMASENGRYQLGRWMLQFQLAVEKAVKGELGQSPDPEVVRKWDTPQGHVARVILLDQYSKACGYMPLENQQITEKLCLDIVNSGLYKKLQILELDHVLYVLLRSESPKLQKKVGDVSKWAGRRYKHFKNHYEQVRAYSEGNAKAIEHFGRLPQLNRALGRNSTMAEKRYLMVLRNKVSQHEVEEELRRMQKEQKKIESELFPEGEIIDPQERKRIIDEVMEERQRRSMEKSAAVEYRAQGDNPMR